MTVAETPVSATGLGFGHRRSTIFYTLRCLTNPDSEAPMPNKPAPLAPATAHGTDAAAPDAPQQPQTALAKAKAQPKLYGPSASVLARALVAGEVKVCRQRRVGTLRLLRFYARGSEVRARAEAMAKAVKADGVRAAAVACGVSLVTARRMVAAVDLSLAIERKELDALWDGKAATVVLPPRATDADA